MENKRYFTRRWQALALAGLIGAGSILPAGTALAAGPGEGANAAVSPGGPGAAGSAPSGGSGSAGATADTTASNPNAWKKVNGIYQMPDGTPIENVIARGIDVSRWQGDINWSQVAADDVSFVMLGTRSKGAVDPYFHKNIQQATAAGIKVGVYIYSLATTPEMAVEEANFVLNLIHDYPVSFPVAFDMEDDVQAALSKEQLAVVANAFGERIREAGYYPMIYANDYWLSNRLDISLMNYPVWVARYSAKPVYQNPVMWQASSTGRVNGINGNVDIDFQYTDFTPLIPANTWRTINGQNYYYQNYVKQKNNWINDGNGWYYMNGEGLASKGWLNVSGKDYYLEDATGKMITGWKQDNGSWYHFGESGELSRGWIEDNGSRYYSNNQGVMQTGWLDDNGNRYFLENNGLMARGWTNQNGQWYYLDSNGILSKGWINDNGSWYYSNSDGVMQTGWLDEGGSRYFLKGSGVMATGWREMDGAWYYFDGSGRMAAGMIDINGLHYYMDPSTGRMAVNTTVDIGGTMYQADGIGALSQATEAGTGEQVGTDVTDASQGNAGNQGSGSAGQASGGPGAVVTPVGPGL